MPDNVVPFDEFDDEIEISAHQTGLPRVVLEGGDDVVLFKRYWFFDYLDRYAFVHAGELGVGDGCNSVRTAVARSVEQGVPAYGLIDRDALFRSAKWDRLFETDDGVFEASTSDEAAATNHRWEIEAYLLEPELIPRWVRSHHRNAPASEADCDAAVARIVDECEQLLYAQSWLAVAHVAGVGVATGHGCHVPAAQFAGHCDAELTALPDELGTAAAVEQLVAGVLAAAPPQPDARLRWLLRYVDTKRLMQRLVHRLSLNAAKHKWVLAEFMEVRGIRPRELNLRLEGVVPLMPV